MNTTGATTLATTGAPTKHVYRQLHLCRSNTPGVKDITEVHLNLYA